MSKCSPAMSELSHLGVIRATGKDTVRFLHAQLSAAVDGLQAGQSTFAALCEPKGRVVALLLLARQEHGVDLVCARSLVDAVCRRLKPYILRDDVRLEVDDARSVAGLDPQAPAMSGEVEPLPALRYAFVPPGTAPRDDAFRARELARGVAWLDPASSGQFLPQMLGHEAIGALSFRKGCYPGQEIIARTRYLGRLKQRAAIVSLPGGTVVPGENACRLVGAGQSGDAVLVDQAADGHSVALLVVRTQEAFTATRLESGDRQWTVTDIQWPPISAREGSPAG